MEKPKDRDFIETVEGLLFCVVGYLHPPDRFTAYLKYVPGDEGRWSREGTRYTRVLPYYHVSQVENTYGYLGEHHPQYLYSCPVRNITVSSVPLDSVKVYYRPRARLSNLFDEGPEDELEGRLVDLVATLSELSGLDTGDFGVTGSLLTESHSPDFSDMDLTIYGRRASRQLKDAILNAKEEGPIRPLSRGKKEEWSRSRSQRHPLSFEDLMGFAERRWNYGTYEGTYFSIHPVRTDDEITEKYGDFTYTQRGEASGEAEISDASESIYLPAIYRVEDVEAHDGSHAEIKEIVSYEGLFCDMFEPGERVEFRGVLERVKDGGERHRVVIGGAGSRPSFMRLVS
jgi:predicted nucleotidyltransferase